MTVTISTSLTETLGVWQPFWTFTGLENFIGEDWSICACILTLSVSSSSHETCPIAFSEELTYWGISELFVEPCCQETYYGRKDMMKKASQREEDNMFIFPNTCIGRTKQWWWYLFEYPTLSLRSKIVALISFFFVMLSTVVLVVSTLLEDFNRDDPNCKWYLFVFDQKYFMLLRFLVILVFPCLQTTNTIDCLCTVETN